MVKIVKDQLVDSDHLELGPDGEADLGGAGRLLEGRVEGPIALLEGQARGARATEDVDQRAARVGRAGNRLPAQGARMREG